MGERESFAEGEERTKAIWHYLGVSVLWFSLIFMGLTLERLGFTSDYLTNVIPNHDTSLKKQTKDDETTARKNMSQNQRLKELLGREQAASKALIVCQNEKKQLEDQLKQSNADGS